MSEFINNKEYRKNRLKDILLQLHRGKDVEEIKKMFRETFTTISSKEITEAEQALIEAGVAVEEIQHLCDIHSSVFREAIVNITDKKNDEKDLGHPEVLMKAENRVLEQKIKELHQLLTQKIGQSFDQSKEAFSNTFDDLIQKIITHYVKKETVFFPFLEKYGIYGPSQVMWGVDNEIKAGLKKLQKKIPSLKEFDNEFITEFNNIIARVDEMIFKEEAILLPMLEDTIHNYEWFEIAKNCVDLGYFVEAPLMKTPPKSQAMQKLEAHEKQENLDNGEVILPSGSFNIEELTTLLNTLPFDITFVDKNDSVKYFSETKDRIFPRARSIIGRKVAHCHPPDSVHIVEDIVADLKSGKKDQEDFWIQMGKYFVLIRYYALRNTQGEYLGIIEVTQNIKEIQALTGEKRLVEPQK